MFSLDVKRMQEKKQREQAWLSRKLTDDSPRAKETRMQRLYGKSPEDMYEEYNQRVSDWASSTIEKKPGWKDNYGHLTSATANPMVWPRDPSKEVGSQFMDNGHYVPHGKYRGGGDCLQSPPPPEPRKPVFDHGKYEDPIDSPFRRRAKDREIQGPLRYNTVVREYADKPQNYDSTWTEPKPLPQWRFPDPSKWCGGEFGVTFHSRDAVTALFEGIANQKNEPSIAATERYAPLTSRSPVVKSKLVPRAVSAPVPHEKQYMNSLLSVNTEASQQLLRELSPKKLAKLAIKTPPSSNNAAIALQTARPR